MQMLCRLLDQVIARCIWLGLAVWFLGSPAFAATPKATPPVATVVTAAVSTPAATPQEVLQTSVKKWVANEQAVSADQVELAPLDARLQVRACDKPLSMDLPFSSPETVRVRCQQPAWQVYVRVSLTARAMSPVPMVKTDKPAIPVKHHVLVARESLSRGMALTEAHVQRVEADTPGVLVNALEKIADLQFSELVRDIPAGTPIRSQDLRPMLLVKRGQLVMVSVGQTQGFQITARVEALQDGRFGEQIKLKNPDSGRQITGLVKGPNLVQGL